MGRAAGPSFDRNVFINCPFDDEYRSLLRPLLFTVVHLGYTPRIASERSDSSENRIDKIIGLIRASRWSIHDISRLRSAAPGEFSRFNLPFELGIDRGAQCFGNSLLRQKRSLLLEAEQYDYKRALSDLSGVDIKNHANEPLRIVREVRNWFVETAGVTNAIGPTRLWYRFNDFASAFYDTRLAEGYSDDDLDFMPVPEYIGAIQAWISERAQ